jgi:hypothetical protein
LGIGTKRLDESKQALLFCEQKRSKKNFDNLDRAGEKATGPEEQKFFGYFFSKK